MKFGFIRINEHKCGFFVYVCVLWHTGPDHDPLAAVPSQSRAVQEHPASGVGAPGEAATTPHLQRLSHQEADEEGGADGDQHGHLPRRHV